MPKGAIVCVFFPRHKKGEESDHGPLARQEADHAPISVDYKALEGLFHLPLKDAAKEIGLCATTFKKACRRLQLEHWPAQKREKRTHVTRRNAQAGGDDAAIGTLRHEPSCAPAAPTLQSTEVHQDKRAVLAVTCIPPVWHDGSIAWSNASASSVSCSATASSSSTVRASSELPALKTLALDAPSYMDSLRGATPLGAGRTTAPEQSCVEAVLAYLDGPLAENFDFMFVDEAGDC
jgi:hypothetical protein